VYIFVVWVLCLVNGRIVMIAAIIFSGLVVGLLALTWWGLFKSPLSRGKK
tara:strand:- start:2137 stop:2286 length:150 start_codon:yes stop_codon:yes gene_type:complete